MATAMDELSQFIQDNPEPRELKRALAVQMVRQDYRHREIQSVLQVSSGFISKWTGVYERQGVEGLRLRHKGSLGYLDASQRQAVLTWLKQKNYWDLQELQAQIDDYYGVVFQSNQSYYELFHEAGISWKKTQKRNPKQDPELVEKKTGNYSLVGGASSSD
jgi:putative transposase